jgi:protocatechuate 3,4-dioxygenase beta subunit
LLIRALGCESVQKFARTRGGETINPQNGAFRFEQIVPDKFTFALGPSVPVEGRVVESGTGRALAEVRVRSSTALAASTVTDARGHYRLEGIPIGRTWIDLIPPSGSRNFPVEVDVFTRADAATVVRDITVPAGALVRGRAIDQRTGKPVQGSLFYFAWESNPELKKVTSVNFRRRPYSPFQTDAQGRFAIPILAGPGILGFRAGPQFQYGVGADRIDCPVEEMYGGGKVFRTLPDLCSAQSFNLLVPLDPRPGEGDLTIDLKLRSGVDVTARVTALDGQPLGEYYVLGASRDVFWSEQSQDRFTIVGCYPEETCRVLLYQPARNLVAFADVTGIPPEPVEIRLRRGASIAGRVLDDDGLPLANANLLTETTKLRAAVGHLAEMKRDRGLFPQVPPTFRTDEKGRFEIKGIIPGLKYTARIQVTRGSTLVRTVPIFTDVAAKSGETKDLGDVRPAPPEDRRTQ